ncbi:MAG: FHA domain-containing protein [Phycisphaera sp.]|nr:FHA domain-containing protein [Phycisphaera sp.]
MSVLTYPSQAVAELLISTPEGEVVANRKLDPTRAYWVGRESSCDIVIENASVSRRHALVFQANGRWLACDAGSHGGLETEQGAVRATPLSADAWIKVGSVYLWLAGGAPDAPDWIDARPEAAAHGKQGRRVHLAIEDLADTESRAVREVLVVTDRAGIVHLCTDLGGLAASKGGGTARLTIGRANTMDLQICDPSVDPLHAVIALGSERWSLIDAGCTSGIFFEGKRWYRKRLEDGITLPIGNYRVSVQRIAATTAPQPATILAPSGRSKPEPRRPSAFLDDSDDSIG